MVCFAKSALQRPVWPIIQNIMLPSRHKNTGLRALSFSIRLSIKLLNSHDTPRSVPALFPALFRSCSGRSPDPPERESAFPVRPAQDVMFQKTAFHRLARGMLYEYRLRLPSECRFSCCRISSSFFPRHPGRFSGPAQRQRDLPRQIDAAKPAACAERKPSVPLGAVASATGGKVINGEAVWHAQHAAKPATVALAQVESTRSVALNICSTKKGWHPCHPFFVEHRGIEPLTFRLRT